MNPEKNHTLYPPNI
jgi:hypothetical protein